MSKLEQLEQLRLQALELEREIAVDNASKLVTDLFSTELSLDNKERVLTDLLLSAGIADHFRLLRKKERKPLTDEERAARKAKAAATRAANKAAPAAKSTAKK
jgi:hypothetical protein